MIEIGGAVHSRGSVIQVKVLGVLAMIDDGETDWKVFCIDVSDPDSDKLNDIEGKNIGNCYRFVKFWPPKGLFLDLYGQMISVSNKSFTS